MGFECRRLYITRPKGPVSAKVNNEGKGIWNEQSQVQRVVRCHSKSLPWPQMWSRTRSLSRALIKISVTSVLQRVSP